MKRNTQEAPPRVRRRKQPVIRQVEFYVISAQDLRKVRSRPMKCYVLAYVSQDNKVKTHTDYEGDVNPSWNERMCLQVEEKLLAEDSHAQLTFDIYCHSFFRDKLVGTVRISLPDAVKAGRHPYPITSFLVFTADGDSQGLLNVCVAPGGRFPRRLDSLSFKRVESDKGMQIEAVPSFKKDVGEAEEVEGDGEVTAGTSSGKAKADLDVDSEDEELGIYDESFFERSQKQRSSLS